jgi:type I restriction enzyme S subunit
MVPPELDGEIASTGFCVLRANPKVIFPKFLFYFTQTQFFIDSLLAQMRGANYPAVTDKNVYECNIPLSPLSEQRKIVEILDQSDALRRKAKDADEKASRILTALFYKMFGDPFINEKGWKKTTFDEIISDTRNGLYKPNEYHGKGISYLKMFNILNGELNLNKVDLIEVDDSEYKAYCLLPGDLLVNRVNTIELVGKCAVITEKVGKAVFESKNIRVRFKSNIANAEYVAHFLNTPFGRASLKTGAKHAIGMATINNSDLRATTILLPPIEKQTEWAVISRSIREQRSKIKANGIFANNLFSTLLHRAFTGALTAGWREKNSAKLEAELSEQLKAIERANTINKKSRDTTGESARKA